MKNSIKYIAHFCVETNTPLGIGSGRSGLLNDRLIARDANGLPYIPGTSLAGVVRHEMQDNAAFDKDLLDNIFGFQADETGVGSRLIFSHGQLTRADGLSAIEGLEDIDFSYPYFGMFRQTPERDHVRITHRGTAAKHGKYDEELVQKGARFVFELELEGSTEDAPIWDTILAVLNSPQFRLGGGTRKGFGQFVVLKCHTKIFNLEEKAALMAYLAMSASLNKDLTTWDQYKTDQTDTAPHWKHYQLELTAERFFLFGSGVMSNEADDTPKEEDCIEWPENGTPELKTHYLIPATSVKGALSHRVAFHYNKAMGQTIESLGQSNTLPIFDEEALLSDYADHLAISSLDATPDSDIWVKHRATIEALTIDDFKDWTNFEEQVNVEDIDVTDPATKHVGENNKAVQVLFGAAKNDVRGNRGRVIFSDVYLDKKKAQKRHFNHVAIDRFTGGARDGALFTQEVSSSKTPIILDMYVHQDALTDGTIKEAWETALNDLAKGYLSLGGATAKGHGVFKGTLQKPA
jgi:CRISPR/Cas system CSM-associated protein Csm3 (group 7 of RAMP superfamily)